MIEVRSNRTVSIAVTVYYCIKMCLFLSMRSPMLPTSLCASTLSDHSHYLCSCLSCYQEMTSAQASSLKSDPAWIYYIVHVCVLVFEATKIKFKPTPRVSS